MTLRQRWKRSRRAASGPGDFAAYIPLPHSYFRVRVRMGQYKYHVFVCTSGKECPKQGSEDVHKALKKGVGAADLKGLVRVNHAGCLNQCGHGPMVVVYPEDTWYAGVDVAGALRIVREHLCGDTPVEEYRYVAPPGDNKLTDD